MAIGRGGFAALLVPDLHRVYIETGKERPLEYPAVLNTPDMETNPIKDQQISGLGTMPSKPEGIQFGLDQPILGGTKSYTAEPFGLAVEITWEMWRDELYGIMRELSREMARSSRNRLEVDAWDPFNGAFDATKVGFTAGEALSGDHVGLDGVTRRNRPTVDVGFSVTGIQNAILHFEGLTDERGLPRLMAPTFAIVTPANKFVAREILGSTGKPFTSDNELNSLIEEDLGWMVAHFITSSTAWFVMAAKGVHNINFFMRDNPIFDSFDDPWTKNAVFTSYQRHTKGFGAWRGLFGSTG
ncbi:hypothetical protein IIA15_07885 [candidate division TA06 bacterium]|nr:hypothetical protein [candidate division TA06 bacterium]